MDYSKSGAPKKGRNAPRHTEAGQGPGAVRADKTDLLARMKAAQGHAMSDDKKKLADIEGEPTDRPNDGAEKIAIDEQGPKTIRGPENIDKKKEEKED
ncbi:hypothetical protein EU805_13980 [Salipiger sp. IMCC34102]|uniref:hypothetical protein n=1 Tax=Salipiger sp. IMCC34102 TaxID=2510647 RepID=UPI00101CFBAE|nr:hypothetical protein [Salipiger sp. IMCC34102]RYH01363.1 hypothetical protein EU805_13980 [Salipiger sp. IMCC34102]